jgi:hypothetical protein
MALALLAYHWQINCYMQYKLEGGEAHMRFIVTPHAMTRANCIPAQVHSM